MLVGFMVYNNHPGLWAWVITPGLCYAWSIT